jgi:hypothetical protein
LSSAAVYGPVHGVRWTGSWANQPIRIERWDIRGPGGGADTAVIELSRVEDDYFAAVDVQTALRAHLDERQWLDPVDALKTQLIMERYAPTG